MKLNEYLKEVEDFKIIVKYDENLEKDVLIASATSKKTGKEYAIGVKLDEGTREYITIKKLVRGFSELEEGGRE